MDSFSSRSLLSPAGWRFSRPHRIPSLLSSGDPDSSERRLNFSQAFNPIGSITGVVIGTAFIFSGVELTPAQTAALKATHQYAAYLQGETLRVVKPYIALGALAFALAAIISRRPVSADAEQFGYSWPGSREIGTFAFVRRPFFMFLGCSPISVCGRAGRYMELFHPVCPGLYA